VWSLLYLFNWQQIKNQRKSPLTPAGFLLSGKWTCDETENSNKNADVAMATALIRSDLLHF
jgi:hypothetical protein